MVNPQLKKAYDELCASPNDADAAWFRARGYSFEKVLAELLRLDNLDPRTSYKAPGEQIDGSFFLDGTVFLMEAKWHKDEIPASTLYQFKGKVDGKLVGTIGVFISMSGFSEDAVNALTLGKSLNLILFDQRDIDAAINKGLGFRSILKRKLRQAAEEGAVYFPTEMDVVTSETSSSVEIEKLDYDAATDSVFSEQVPARDWSGLVVICEGSIDRELILQFAKRILASIQSRRSIKIVVAMGKYSVPKVANAMMGYITSEEKILIVVDGDNNIPKTLEMLKKNIYFDRWLVSMPDPTIETWLGIDSRVIRRQPITERTRMILEAAAIVDIEELKNRDQSFRTFYSALTGT